MVRLFKGKTPEIKDKQGKRIPEGIASLEAETIGGIKQWLLIRSYNINNPLLLYLHGGPGSPEMPLAYKFERNLEKHFTFINWDQRGAGKSFSKNIPKESMNIEQFISDAHELILKLLKRFGKKKLILVGHSWGSALGTLLVQRFPELFDIYVGIGQVVNTVLNEEISYNFTLEKAKKTNNKKALRQLANLQPPYDNNLNQLKIQRKWLNYYGGAIYGRKNSWSLLKVTFGSPEYSIREVVKYLKGTIFSLKSIWKQYSQSINFMESMIEWKIPVYFIAGKSDYNTPFELVEQYYQKITAPKKELIWFEKSAHTPNFEEPEKFDEIMIKKILPTLKENN